MKLSDTLTATTCTTSTCVSTQTACDSTFLKSRALASRYPIHGCGSSDAARAKSGQPNREGSCCGEQEPFHFALTATFRRVRAKLPRMSNDCSDGACPRLGPHATQLERKLSESRFFYAIASGLP